MTDGGSCVAALDVGGTIVKGALVRADGSVVHRERWPTRAADGPEAVLAGVERAARRLLDVGGGKVATVGVAVPGQIDEAAGIGMYSANLGWRDLPVAARLRDALGLPVVLAHDIRAGAVAEGRLGAARGAPSFLFLALGTGIGAAVVLDGAPLTGAARLAGEIGHVRVASDGATCGCGGAGCLETVASASAIARRYADAAGGGAVTAEEVARRMGSGDPVARRVWDEAIGALAAVLAVAVATVDLELVVVGGGLSRAGDALAEPLRRELAARLPLHPTPRLALAALGDEAGCLGAALQAWDRAAT